MTGDINLPMSPTLVPLVAREHRPDTRVLDIGPPPGVSEHECSTVNALMGRINGFAAVADYWRPTPEQLEVLNNGGFIELVQYVPRMIMHSLSVWPDPPEVNDVFAATLEEAVGIGEEILQGSPVDGLAAAAATLVDEYADASWTRRYELVDTLRDRLADFMRSDA